MRIVLLLGFLTASAFGQSYVVDNFGGPVTTNMHPMTLGPNMFSFSENLLINGRTRISRPGWSDAFTTPLGSSDPADAIHVIEGDDSVWVVMLTDNQWWYTTIGGTDHSIPGGGYTWLSSWNEWREVRPFTQGLIDLVLDSNEVEQYDHMLANDLRFLRDVHPGDTLYTMPDSLLIGVVKWVHDDQSLVLENTITAPMVADDAEYFVRRSFARRPYDLTPGFGKLYGANGIDPIHEFKPKDSAIYMRRMRVVDTVHVQYASYKYPLNSITYPFVDENGKTSIKDTTGHTGGMWNIQLAGGNSEGDSTGTYWQGIKVLDSTKAWADGEWAGLLGGQSTGANLYYFAFNDKGDLPENGVTFPESFQHRYFRIVDNFRHALYLAAPIGEDGWNQKWIDSAATSDTYYPKEALYWVHQDPVDHPLDMKGYIFSIAGDGERVAFSGDSVTMHARANGAWLILGDTAGTHFGVGDDRLETGDWDHGIYYLHDLSPQRGAVAIDPSDGFCENCRENPYDPFYFIRRMFFDNSDTLKILTDRSPDSVYRSDSMVSWEILRYDIPKFAGLEVYKEELVGWGDTLTANRLMHSRTTVRGAEPDNWSTEGDIVISRTREDITAVYPYDDRLFVWTENTTNAIVGNIDTGPLEEITIDIGCTAPSSVVGRNKSVFWYWQGDFYVASRRDLTGHTVQSILPNNRNIFNDIMGARRRSSLKLFPMNPTKTHEIQGIYDPQTKRIWYFYADTGSTEQNTAITINPLNGQMDGFHTFGASDAFSYKYRDTIRMFMGHPGDGMIRQTDGSFQENGVNYQIKIGGVILRPNSDSVLTKIRDIWLRFGYDNTADTAAIIGVLTFTYEIDEVNSVAIDITYQAVDKTDADTRLTHISIPFHKETAGAGRTFTWELRWWDPLDKNTSLVEFINMTLNFRPERAGD